MVEVNADVVAAFFAGIGAVTSSIIARTLASRRAHRECDERIEAFRSGLHEMEKHEKTTDTS